MKSLLPKINYFTYIILLIAFFCGFIKNSLIIFGIVFIHELGHITLLKIFNYQILDVEIYPFGGITKYKSLINSSINKDLLISIGGVLFQLILLLIVILVRNYISVNTYYYFIKYNTVIMIFNLLPIVPLDGNKIITLLLEKIFSYKVSYFINLYISILFIIIYFIFNYHYSLNNYLLIGLFIYKTIELFRNYEYNHNKFLLERHLYTLPYKKIEHDSYVDLDILKKETLHFFKKNNNYYHEKVFIKNRYKNNI